MIRFLSGSQHPRLSVSALPPLLPRQRFVGSNYNKTLHLLKIFFLNWQNESLRGSKQYPANSTEQITEHHLNPKQERSILDPRRISPVNPLT